MNFWLICFILLGTTVLTRGFFLLFGDYLKVGSKFIKAIRYAPMTALIATVAPTIFTHSSSELPYGFSYTHHEFLATLVAVIVHIQTRHMITTMLAAIIIFVVLRVYA